MARCGQAFKDRAVARMLPPESASADVVAREIGVGADTLERWRSEALSRSARERVWAAAARFDAVLTTAALSGPEEARASPQLLSIAVGMPVTRHPPHRSVLAQLRHTAPTSGI
ncbi:MAG: transposase [Burkholderiales bacterium]|nr:transposase [Burkholderiales bacterium]